MEPNQTKTDEDDPTNDLKNELLECKAENRSLAKKLRHLQEQMEEMTQRIITLESDLEEERTERADLTERFQQLTQRVTTLERDVESLDSGEDESLDGALNAHGNNANRAANRNANAAALNADGGAEATTVLNPLRSLLVKNLIFNINIILKLLFKHSMMFHGILLLISA